MKSLLNFLVLICLVLSFSFKANSEEFFDDPARRFEEFEKQRKFPFDRIPDYARQKAFYQTEELKSKLQAQWLLANQPKWKPIGPFDVGGRIKSIAIHPTKSGWVYAAAAAGGIWLSTNNGNSWEPIFDFENGIAFGSIAIDPQNPNIIYAGTGESVIGGGVIYLGNGLYKSTDEGKTWKLMGLTEVGAFSKVYVHPANSNIVVAGATIRQPGFYLSTDAGKTWSRLFDRNVTDVALNPTNPNEYLIGVNSEGIYYTSDGGVSWQIRNNGLAGGFGRISVQISKSNPDIAYALLDVSSRGLLYKTTNKGQSWTLVFQGETSFFNGQGFYDNFIEIHPTNPNIVLAGGIDVFRTIDGKNFVNVTNGYSGGNVHVDQHCATFDPKNPNNVFLGNDGGVYFSSDAGANWVVKNNNLQVTQFYGFDIDNTKQNVNFGGTQDNGSLAFTEDNDWIFIAGGDGFRTVVDYLEPNIVYGQSTPGGRIVPFRLNLKTGEYKYLDKGLDFTVGVWDPPLIIHPILNYILYHGRNKLYVSYNYGDNWEVIQTPTSGGRFTAISVSSVNPDYIAAGTSIGEVIVSTDAGETWKVVNDNGLPIRWVTDIEFSNSSENTFFVTFSGFFNEHIYKTTDLGKTWISLGKSFPDIPVNSVALHPIDENLVFVATDIGVFASYDGGKEWFPYGTDLPRSPAVDLKFCKYNLSSPTIPLRAATHGRGIWEVEVPMETIASYEITSPSGGEIYTSQTSQIISWYGFKPPVKVEYSIDDGTSWTVVADEVQSSPLLWLVPNKPTEFGRIRISSKADPSQVKISNSFTIALIQKGSIVKNIGVNFIPYGIAFDGIDGLWVTSFQSNRLVRLNSTSLTKEKTITLPGDSLFTDLAIDRENQIIYVHRMNSTAGNGGIIIVIDTNGNVLNQYTSPAPSYPIGLEYIDGKLYVGDRDKKDEFGKQILYVADPKNGKVEKTYQNPYSKTYGPRGLSSDKANFLYQIGTHFPSGGALTEAVAIRMPVDNPSVEYDRIYLQRPTGIINARGIEFDPRDGNLWITDYEGNIYKIAGFELQLGVEAKENKSLQCLLYPNPANDFVNLYLSNNFIGKQFKVEICDVLGSFRQVVFEGFVEPRTTKSIEINLDKLNSGMYFAVIYIDNTVEKVIKFNVIK